MGLLTYMTFFVVLFYGVQLRSVDTNPKYARRYCGANLASELERRCRTRGYNGPEQKTPYLLFQDKKVKSIATMRSKEKDIIDACCHSSCTEDFLDSFCLSPTPDDTTMESETVETTTIIGRKNQRTKKPKSSRKSGRKSKGSDVLEESAANRDYETQTETPRNKNSRDERKKNKGNRNKKEKNKCDKKTLRDKNGNPCTRRSKEEKKEKEKRRNNRKRNKKNKPTRRPKRWDSETTTLSDFLLSQRFLQGTYDSDIDDQSNVDGINTQLDVVQEGDTSWSVSHEESSSNEVISDAQRTEQFRPPFRPIIPVDTPDESYDNNMYIHRPTGGNTRKGEPSLDNDPVAKLKKIKTFISGLMQDSSQA